MQKGDIVRITGKELDYHCFKEGEYVIYTGLLFKRIKSELYQELGVEMYVHKPIYNERYKAGLL